MNLNTVFFFHFIFLIFRWNRIFGNNALTAPVEEIDFRPGKKGEFVPRAAAQRDDGTPLACIKGGPNYINAYKGFLEELQEICPDACIFKSIPKLDSEETDTADSDHEDEGKLFFTVY